VLSTYAMAPRVMLTAVAAPSLPLAPTPAG